MIDWIYCQIPSWTINALLLLNIDAGHPIQSSWIVVPRDMQCMKPAWIHTAALGMTDSRKKKNCLLSTEPKWHSELWNYKDKVELLTACEVVQGQPTWQMLWHSYCSESEEEATSSVSCTWARVWRLIYHYACRKGKWAILSRRNREVNSMTDWGNYHRYIWQWFR